MVLRKRSPQQQSYKHSVALENARREAEAWALLSQRERELRSLRAKLEHVRTVLAGNGYGLASADRCGAGVHVRAAVAALGLAIETLDNLVRGDAD